MQQSIAGASRSYFPLALAADLGLSLTRDANPSAGVGAQFETWSASEPIHAQIVAAFPEDPQLVGPIFTLWPGFGDPGNLLLGRADFFQVFAITFNENPSAPIFHLDF